MRARVAKQKARLQGASAQSWWAHDKRSQRRRRAFCSATRRAGGLRGARRRCRLLAGVQPARRLRL